LESSAAFLAGAVAFFAETATEAAGAACFLLGGFDRWRHDNRPSALSWHNLLGSADSHNFAAMPDPAVESAHTAPVSGSANGPASILLAGCCPDQKLNGSITVVAR
jgi:hypothetical protein